MTRGDEGWLGVHTASRARETESETENTSGNRKCKLERGTPLVRTPISRLSASSYRANTPGTPKHRGQLSLLRDLHSMKNEREKGDV